MFKKPKAKKPEAEGSKVKRAYAKLGRAAHKTLTPITKLYLRDKHVRVRALVISEDREVLLVRNWFGSQKWTLPGGGIRRDETPAEATVREVYEETGLRVATDHLHELGTFKNQDPKLDFTIACYQVDIPNRPPRIAHHRRLEMLDVAWFPLNSLPAEHSPTVDLAIALLS